MSEPEDDIIRIYINLHIKIYVCVQPMVHNSIYATPTPPLQARKLSKSQHRIHKKSLLQLLCSRKHRNKITTINS